MGAPPPSGDAEVHEPSVVLLLRKMARQKVFEAALRVSFPPKWAWTPAVPVF